MCHDLYVRIYIDSQSPTHPHTQLNSYITTRTQTQKSRIHNTCTRHDFKLKSRLLNRARRVRFHAFHEFSLTQHTRSRCCWALGGWTATNMRHYFRMGRANDHSKSCTKEHTHSTHLLNMCAFYRHREQPSGVLLKLRMQRQRQRQQQTSSSSKGSDICDKQWPQKAFAGKHRKLIK